MSGRVIQGFFIGGTLRVSAALPSIVPDRNRRAPCDPVPVHAAAAQRFGGGRDGFAIDPVQLGLVRSGGRALPAAVLAKMEAAFRADFSNVRVHVGPQAARIGAIAFTTGNDLYFAPGQFQPDSVKGQQLIGHELAHVIQQREGRVRAPGSGVAVVQDHALEAEADRLGMRAAALRLPVQAKGAPGGRATHPGHPGPIQRAVAVSAPEPVGAGRFRLTARDQGRAVGSVTVDVKNRAGAFVTDLGVDQSHRHQGVGKMLLAHAARTGMRFGKTSVELAADDGGSGRLLHWYKDMGFAQTGTNERREPTFRAAASRIGTVQTKLTTAHRGPSDGERLVPVVNSSRHTVLQRSSIGPAYHRRGSLDASDDKQMEVAEKLCSKALTSAYNILVTCVNDFKDTGSDSYAVKQIPGYVSGVVNSGNGAPASWFSKFVEHMTTATQHTKLATSFGTAVCEYMYYVLNGSDHKMMGNFALESPKPVLLPNGDWLTVDYSKIGKTSGSRPDVRVVLPQKGEGVIDVTSSTAKPNHTMDRQWAKQTDCRYISEITYPGMTNQDLTDPNYRFKTIK